ncbi:glucosaminidase domain-containing protein [Fusobacterium perfoetens]|uniref:glucosaminidase domain-containing protein n=1 Tax=Fusobacterium perfoetens TaxID=852 RepID=UPI001F31C207|nr:glucosaminidase domain-containing protein [Fusobacterium perfoetens]
MKVIKIKKLERKKIEKNIFMFLVLFIFFLFTIISYGSQKDLKNQADNFLSASKTITKVKYDKIVVNSLDDIYKERDGLFVFSDINIDLRNLSPVKRKDVFIKLLLPSIEVVQQEVLNNREIVKKLKIKKELTENEKQYAEKLFKKYKTEYGKWEELESKMIVYPASLILTQGAIESAWGTSRFFREGNNAFGVWSTNPNEPRIAAKGSRGDFTPHLKKYDTLKDTVEDITLIISRSSAYSNARKMIWEGKSPYEIAGGLLKYSEEGHEYVKKVRSTLKYNNFQKYDEIF